MSATLAALAAAVPIHFPRGWEGPRLGAWFVLALVLCIALVAVLLAVFGRRWRRAATAAGDGPNAAHGPARQAEATLAQRYAQGDIDEAEYRARLEVIRTHAAP